MSQYREFFMRPDHPHWDAAWRRLSEESINVGLRDPFTAACPVTGETWQYVGSFVLEPGCVHEFRHRHHPAVSGRVIKRLVIDAPLTEGGE